jgi:NAD(P)H dehydrogenase (quinone)
VNLALRHIIYMRKRLLVRFYRGHNMYAVMGITGQVGGAVAEMLITRGERVRGIVRNAEKAAAWKVRGVELAIADYDDAADLETAFRGVDGVFVMIPANFAPSPDFREPRRTIAAIRAALSEARPDKAVYLSSIGAQQSSGLGLITSLHILEQELGSLGIPGAFLRAGWFMENCAWDVNPAREQGKVFSFLQPLDHPFPLVATIDIGRVAADIVLQTWQGNRYIEIAGPRYYTPYDIAAEFTSVLGRNVEAVAVPRETWVSAFVAQGAPADRTGPRIEMLDGFNSGWIRFGVPGAEHVTSTTELKTVLKALAG